MQAPPPLSKAASYFDENVLDQEVHEQKKQLTTDRDTFLNFLHLVFPEPTL